MWARGHLVAELDPLGIMYADLHGTYTDRKGAPPEQVVRHYMADIHHQLCEVYGDDAISDGMVRRWVRKFNEVRISVHDEQHTGRPSLINDDLVRAVDEKIHEDRRFTISLLSLNFPQMLRSGSQSVRLWVRPGKRHVLIRRFVRAVVETLLTIKDIKVDNFRNLTYFPITMPWNLLTLCCQIRGHHIAKLDPLGISSADLDDKHPPELLYSHYSFGKNW
ncbi:hypothetical protein ANN_20477 [Periplaneta americana]|uniref:Mos1 transposase HTH domain-containing protein n=1 Tax=Periplaneta americana TaxID=6978 RepID=A0ABQ8SDU7_PERAM|nr:hypothetical protein ANN_20477 [Periplaneta americana]